MAALDAAPQAPAMATEMRGAGACASRRRHNCAHAKEPGAGCRRCCRAVAAPAAAREALPPGFVYLRDVAPGIAQDMRYATADNFTGRPLPGYAAGECVLRRDAALALARVEADLEAPAPAAENLRLLPPDARGARHGALGRRRATTAPPALLSDAAKAHAVRARLHRHPFAPFDRHRGRPHAGARSRRRASPPSIARALRRLHRAGGPTRARQQPRHGHRLRLLRCEEPHRERRASRRRNSARRALLVAAMRRRGFNNYFREWWHFEFAGGAPRRAYDVPIVPRRH